MVLKSSLLTCVGLLISSTVMMLCCDDLWLVWNFMMLIAFMLCNHYEYEGSMIVYVPCSDGFLAAV